MNGMHASALRHNDNFNYFRLWTYLISWLDEMLKYIGNKFSMKNVLWRVFHPCGTTSWRMDIMSHIMGLRRSLNISFSLCQHGVTLEMFWRVRVKFLKLKAPTEMLYTTAATWPTCCIICEYAWLSLVQFLFETSCERD